MPRAPPALKNRTELDGANDARLPASAIELQHCLTAAQFQGLAAMPAELEWFSNIDNAHTRKAYRVDIVDFRSFAGIGQPEELRQVTRAHVIAWRGALEGRNPSGATIRRKLAALPSLCELLCEHNAIAFNPVTGTKRPKVDSREGRTPALSAAHARRLLDAPPADTLKGKRVRAILSVLLYQALRREELSKRRVKDLPHLRSSVPHVRVQGK